MKILGALFRQMVAYELPIEPTLEAIAKLPYDCGVDLVVVTPNDVVRIIDRCVSGDLSVQQLSDWAEFLEVRDGVGFAPPHAERLGEIVFALANPLINEELTPTVLNRLRIELAGLPPNSRGSRRAAARSDIIEY